MPSGVFVDVLIAEADDGPGALGGGDDGKALVWDNGTGHFVMATMGGGGVALDDPNIWLATQTFQAANASPVVGSEMLTNPNFTTDLSGWTADPGWTWDVSGAAIHTPGTGDTLSQAISLTQDAFYQISLTITGRTAGSVQVYSDNYLDLYWQKDSNDAFSTITLAYSTGADTLNIIADSDFDGMIDSVSLKPVALISAPVIVANVDGRIGADFRPGGSGKFNFFNGIGAGGANTDGFGNAGIGSYCLLNNTTGNGNTGFGANVLQNNKTGELNAGFGLKALYSNISGSRNTAFAAQALTSNIDGDDNVAGGLNALYSNKHGSRNTVWGNGAGYSVTGDGGVYVGFEAGYNETSPNKLHIGNNQTLSLIVGTMATTAAAQVLQLHAANFILADLPTSNPGSNGVWLDNNLMTIGASGNAARTDAANTFLRQQKIYANLHDAVLGDELITVNPDFATDLSGWTLVDGGWSWDSGAAIHDTGSDGQMTQDVTIPTDDLYFMEVVISGWSGAGYPDVYTDSFGLEPSIDDNGTWNDIQNLSAGANTIHIDTIGGFDGRIESVSLKQVIDGGIPAQLVFYDRNGARNGEINADNQTILIGSNESAGTLTIRLAATTIVASDWPTSPGASGTLWIDEANGNVLKRV